MITIFLDCDGVLNHSKSDWTTNMPLDKDCINNYFKILNKLDDLKLNYNIILSSDWGTNETACQKLKHNGIKWNDKILKRGINSTRDQDIQNYINRNYIKLNKVIILDDSCSKSIFGDSLILCHPTTGGLNNDLTQEAINKIDRIQNDNNFIDKKQNESDSM